MCSVLVPTGSSPVGTATRREVGLGDVCVPWLHLQNWAPILGQPEAGKVASGVRAMGPGGPEPPPTVTLVMEVTDDTTFQIT